MALRKELNYRPTANGVEISEASVRKYEKAGLEAPAEPVGAPVEDLAPASP